LPRLSNWNQTGTKKDSFTQTQNQDP